MAGSDQLRAYASLIGIGFDTVDTMAGLAQALEEASGKDLVLIDTPGFGPADMDEAAELAMFLSRHRQIEVQLVMPAMLRTAVMQRVAERFSIFQPSRMLYTNIDDAAGSGGAIELAMRTGLPILVPGLRPAGAGRPGGSLEGTVDRKGAGRMAGTGSDGGVAWPLDETNGSMPEADGNQESNMFAYATAAALSPDERERLILEHMPQVNWIASRIQEKLPPNIQLDDLISAGILGLIAAVDNFDPSHNARCARTPSTKSGARS